jgi:hypothetical protein
MLLLIDIFSINRSQGYENPSLEIIIIEICSTGGFPLEEAYEHFSQNQSTISVVVVISFQCYCGDCSGYITVILPFLAFYFCSAYFLYLIYYTKILLRYPLVTSVTCRYPICLSVIKMRDPCLLFILLCSFVKGLPSNHFPYFRANPFLTTCPLSNLSINFII